MASSNMLLEQAFNEVAKKFNADTTAYKDFLYPKISNKLDTSKGKSDYHKCISNFIQTRTEGLYDNLPCTRLVFGENDIQEFFKAIDLDRSLVIDAIGKSYYGNEPNFSPLAAKDEFTIAQLCVLRYFVLKNQTKDAELALIHLCFSGKFYPSLHYRSFRIPPIRHIMEYTVNNVLSTKFDLISEGSVIGAIKKVGLTWLNTYKNKIKSFTDEDVVYIIQQLYSRIGSFMKNIATAYYKVHDNKDDLYIAYSSDSYDEDDYHVSDNDSFKINKITEKTVNAITTGGIDYSICKSCSDENITINEIKSIMESLFGDPQNMPEIRELISLMITTYFQANSGKDVTNVSFITFSITPKPNSKQKEILRQKEIVEHFLRENSTSYMRRRSRVATRNSFERAIRTYFALAIHNSNR